jgi:hypothetical protein
MNKGRPSNTKMIDKNGRPDRPLYLKDQDFIRKEPGKEPKE